MIWSGQIQVAPAYLIEMQLYLRLAPGEGRRAESIGFARSFDLAKAVEQAKKEEADSKCQERHPRLLEMLCIHRR